MWDKWCAKFIGNRMVKYIRQIILLLFFVSCGSSQTNSVKSGDTLAYKAIAVKQDPMQEVHILNASGKTIQDRFNPPAGYTRIVATSNSFANYLRSLPLKEDGAMVHYYNGEEKYNNNTYAAVVDLPIGSKDLHQCADAVMRLRAEYFYNQKQYDKIHFNFTNGFRVDYKKWAAGQRIAVEGNRTWWVDRAQPSHSYNSFWSYLETIFSYAGSYSLSKELKPIAYADLQIGDVFILGGSPGHCVIVVDMAQNKYGHKVYMIAQSYMPAQEIQVLTNKSNRKLSPWYILNNYDETIYTPEWTFESNQVMRFGE